MKKQSAVRKFSLWWFSKPMSPWVSVNISVDFSHAQAYLKHLSVDCDAPKVSVHHLIAASIARGLQKTPQANANIIGGQIFRRKSVHMAMPVNLLGHKGGETRELSMMFIKELEKKTLRMLAKEGRHNLKQERQGKLGDPFLKAMLRFAETLPSHAVFKALGIMDRMLQQPKFAQKIYNVFPVTTALSNPGSTLPRNVDGTGAC